MNFHPNTQKSENFTLGALFVQSMKVRAKKNMEKLSFMESLIKPCPCGFKTGMRNWVNVH